jgi:thioredoxin reductase
MTAHLSNVSPRYDVIVVGGGPAGLSAALMLGRCRRKVLVCDSGRYRNAASAGVHGFLSRDGMKPLDLIRVAREQLRPYEVEVCNAVVKSVIPRGSRFRIALESGEQIECRRVLLATGVVDQVPSIEGIEPLYGKSVHHCPYCDAWEHRDQPIAAYGKGRPAMGLAMSLKTWSSDVVLLTNGPTRLSPGQRKELDSLEIPVRAGRIGRLEGKGGDLHSIVFKNGDTLARRAIFFNTGQHQTCNIASELGCTFTKRGAIRTDKFEQTCVPGVFAAGDCSRNVQFVSVAVAEGAVAAEAINVQLQEEDRQKLLASRVARSGGAHNK